MTHQVQNWLSAHLPITNGSNGGRNDYETKAPFLIITERIDECCFHWFWLSTCFEGMGADWLVNNKKAATNFYGSIFALTITMTNKNSWVRWKDPFLTPSSMPGTHSLLGEETGATRNAKQLALNLGPSHSRLLLSLTTMPTSPLHL